MSSPKTLFSRGITAFQTGKYQDALQYFTQASIQALDQGCQRQEGQQQLYYSIYDSRAATYEKLERLNDALLDVKHAIDLIPSRWQGYARAARLMLRTQRYDVASKMADRALTRLDARFPQGKKFSEKASGDTGATLQRRAELESIKATALENLASKDVNTTANKVEVTEKKRTHATEEHLPQCFIASLPTELLTEIFAILIAQDHNTLPSIILRVCRTWRRIAWDCPALWNTLVVGVRKGSRRSEPRRKATVWLTRSAGHISDLRVHANAVEHTDWRKNLEEELKGLKWHGLRSLLIETWDMDDYLKSITIEAPLKFLSNLEIVDDIAGSTPRDYLLSEACHLVELSLTRAQLSFDSISSRLLRHISLRNCYHDQQHIFKILESQPLLQTFTVLELPAKFLRRWHYKGDLRLDHLTHIDLTMCFSVLLDKLIVPNLQVLRISQSGFALDAGFIHLATLNLMSFKELSLSCVPCQVGPLADFLDSVPTLTTLELTSCQGLASGVVEVLSRGIKWRSQNSSPPCPRLQHINVSQSPDIRSATLVRFIKSRLSDSQERKMPLQIHTLKMDGCPGVESDLLPWFREYVPVVSCTYLSKKAATRKR